MAITSQDQFLAGCRPPEFFWAGVQLPPAGAYWSQISTRLSEFASHSIPGYPRTTLASTVDGEALSAPYQGAISFTNPPAGQNAYLANFTVSTPNSAANGFGNFLLADRVWHSGAIDVTSTAPQTINSVAFAPRDENGTSDGLGIYIGVELRTSTGAGTPNISVSYTNSAGVSGQTAQNAAPTTANASASFFWPLRLAAGDVGVRSIQSLTLSSSWTSGTVILCAYRILAQVDVNQSNFGSSIDGIAAGLPRIYDGSVLHILSTGNTSGTTVLGNVTVTQG